MNNKFYNDGSTVYYQTKDTQYIICEFDEDDYRRASSIAKLLNLSKLTLKQILKVIDNEY